ncbi:MAG TPA: DNA (cytosine-5-)-methyltransferase [Mycobacteriales bacterium]|nr:DNA (cytosine-5-)-methyltransferase [Mycobacteriales bacterium]
MGTPMVKVQRSAALRLEADPRAPTWKSWPEWAKRQSRPLAVDLFCGGGGLSLGLEDAGFRVALAVDHDPWSIETHAANMQGLAVEMDLSDETKERRLTRLLKQADIALIAGGPPCQPFSRAGRSAIRHLVDAGKRNAIDERRDLWEVWLRIVLAVSPNAVMLENVPDLALGDDLRIVRQILGKLEDAGYETYIDVVEAPELGIPQHRQRFILVALRTDRPFTWPTPRPQVNIWDAISDLPALGEGTGADELPYRRPKTPFQERARAGMTGRQAKLVFDHVARAVRDDDREAFKLMTPTTRYSDLPERLRRYRADTFDDKYKRHGKHELARSITAHIAKDGYWYIHPTEERTFTVREAARLQTFPDWYRFAGNRTHAYRQIGNAVPPLLAERIGRQILIALGHRVPAETEPTIAGHQPPAHIPRETLQAARTRLDEWAEKDAAVSPWRHPCDPWSALISSVLGNNKVDDGTIHYILWQLPTPDELTARRLADMAVPRGARTALERLLPAAKAWRAAQRRSQPDDEARWWESVVLQPAEAARFSVLAFNDDALLTTQPPMRVVARITGRPVDRVDRLSDGRLALAALVGGGPKAGARMAAVVALGRAVCTLQEPLCDSCPFVGVCRQASCELTVRSA